MVGSEAQAVRAGLLDDYLSPAELASELGVTTATLSRWRSARKGPRVTKLGNKVIYHREDVEAWISEQRGAGR